MQKAPFERAPRPVPAPRGRLPVVLLALTALLAAAPPPLTAARQLIDPAPGAGAPVTTSLVAAVALTAWALAGWLVMVALLASAAGLPGATGRLAASAVRRIAPAAVRRAVALVGVGIALTPVAPAHAQAAAQGPGPTGHRGALAAGPGRPAPLPPAAAVLPVGAADLDWPTRAGAPVVPPLDWPAADSGTARSRTPASSRSAAASSRPDVRARTRTVVVRPGDCLWRLAARSLDQGADDAAVARTWPAWWAANRSAIGPDPDVLLVGTRLIPPAG